MPWFQKDLRTHNDSAQIRGKNGRLIAPAELPYALTMLVLVAELSLTPGYEGQQTVASQKEGSWEPSTL